MPEVEIICMANSRKHGGRCVAGLRADGKGWIRPVSPLEDGTLLRRHYQLNDGSEPKLLDILRIDLKQHKSEPHQPENWIIGSRTWQLVSRPAQSKFLNLIKKYIISGPDLLSDNSDRLNYKNLSESPVKSSLALILPRNLKWQIMSFEGKRKIRANFRLGKIWYNLGITDPIWAKRLDFLDEGSHPSSKIGIEDDSKILLTVSLGEPFEKDNCCYKLVAAVIVFPTSP